MAIRGPRTTSPSVAVISSKTRRWTSSGLGSGAVLFNDFLYRKDYAVDICIRHAGVHRQGKHALEGVFCHRVVSLVEAEALAVVAVVVDRDEVHARADLASTQLLLEL